MPTPPTIAVLDGHTLNPGDLSWAPLETLGSVSVYPRSAAGSVLDRATGAQLLLVNKVVLSKEHFAALPQLQAIFVTATGVNNIDLEAARARGLAVYNVAGYGTPAVAQHVFALLLALTNRVVDHSRSVKAGDWSAQEDFCYTLHSIPELSTLTLGIYGFGRIGQAVAEIGQAFGMRILAHHKHPERDARPGVTFVDLPTLFRESHAVTLHAPLSEENEGIVSTSLLQSMPSPAYLINTGRGGLVDETALLAALQSGHLTGAALDVLGTEPPPADHPLLAQPNCLITPHMAWATRASRQRLLEATVNNVRDFLEGGTGRNRLV
ncbi:MAG: D-2-hydroxyacid dehydrogenase [Lewinella sp.]|nr:D-2-hydroxyacid dehydrogenase [Lewinella sp.]